MRRPSSLIALPLAAIALFSASIVAVPVPEAAAQATPKPTAKPAGAATAPRAGGIPLELAGSLVAGGSALAAGGLYALRRRKRTI
jgi:hypothetical protein